VLDLSGGGLRLPEANGRSAVGQRPAPQWGGLRRRDACGSNPLRPEAAQSFFHVCGAQKSTVFGVFLKSEFWRFGHFVGSFGHFVGSFDHLVQLSVFFVSSVLMLRRSLTVGQFDSSTV
jgi:hypothetical protein